jgi:hypothetical protein
MFEVKYEGTEISSGAISAYSFDFDKRKFLVYVTLSRKSGRRDREKEKKRFVKYIPIYVCTTF